MDSKEQNGKAMEVDISKLKLTYKDVSGAGKQIHANFGLEFDCIEFTMRGDVPQPITWTYLDPPNFLFCERWIQFPPKEWDELIEAVYKELVNLWNEKYNQVDDINTST